jgi:thymidine kinase
MYVQDTDTWANKIKKDRTHLLAAIEKQEKAKRASNNGTQSSKDPWLSKRQISLEIQDLTDKENQFQKRMCFLFDEVLKFDEHIVVELKRLFEKYSMEQQLYAQTVVVRFSVRR